MDAKRREVLGKKIPLFIAVLTFIQPILDLLTSLGLAAGLTITVGVAVRALIMIVAFVYVAFISRFPKKRICMIYFAVVTGYIVLFMLYMLATGGFSALIGNCKDVIKTFFYPYVLLFFYAIYAEHRALVSDRVLSITMLVYTGSILIAYLTNTSNVTYYSGYGFSGWFYAANEISDIIAITAPIAIYYLTERIGEWGWGKYLCLFLALASLCFASSFIGTKLVYLVVLVYFILCGGWNLIRGVQIKQSRNKMLARGAICIVCVAVMLIGFEKSPLRGYINDIYIPMQNAESDVYQNSVDNDWIDENRMQNVWMVNLIEQNPIVFKFNTFTSRRLTGMALPLQVYLDGDATTKVMGIGYAQMDHYKYPVQRMVEMDPCLLIIRHGILGFTIFFLPFLLIVIWAIVRWWKHPLQSLKDLRYCTYLYSFLVTFAMSVFAGHTLTVPSVSYYAALVTLQIVCIMSEPSDSFD